MPQPVAPTPIHHWSEAIAFAVDRHGDDLRKGTRIPYVTHVIAVAETLAYHYPERDALIVAGLLHDVVEDTEHVVRDARSALRSGGGGAGARRLEGRRSDGRRAGSAGAARAARAAGRA